MNIVDKIINNFKNNKNLYIGERVTISEHMIQTAMLAEKKNSSKALICSCLLHDYGHFIINEPDLLVSQSQDGKHEDLGFKFLKNYFVQEVVEPIKLHVLAKKYLCREKSYYDLLSEASKTSLKFQGGIMTDEETKKFTSFEFHKDAIKVRKFDDVAKLPNIKIKSISDYRDLLISQLLK